MVLHLMKSMQAVKKTRYYHNSATMYGENTAITDTDLEIKGRGNTTWNMKKTIPNKTQQKPKLVWYGKGKNLVPISKLC